ncbi:hypothetical protein HPB49_017297 [Dermacentor silvarum]|uniref:Uncharacterized protein n=1 Tax=Dermacentor silvarum TaxID=543639 RepID=A0ACB8E2M3_DERSI|nr:hypothetical protein HPB49_017297 [Dermacentor silvarum]
MAVRVRLLGDRDSETTSVVLGIIAPPPVVRSTTATSRNPTTEESTMVPTFAMLGCEECPAVVYLMPSKLDQRVDKLLSEGQTCDVAATYLEVYNKSYATVTENATSTRKQTRVSMCSVDLAGAERAAAASRDPEDQIREGTKLNLSLLALGNCIDARPKNGTQQVPYQDSKLTHILKDSLGGSGDVLVIGTATAVKLN